MSMDMLNIPNAIVSAEKTKSRIYFDAVCNAFRQAGQSARGFVDCFYNIGGFTVRLRFAGSALVPYIKPALAHLATKPDSAPSLTVCLMDSASTLTKIPPIPWKEDDYVVVDDIRPQLEGDQSIIHFKDNHIEGVFLNGSETLSILNYKQKLAIFWVQSAHQIPLHDRGSPLLKVFHWWMRNYGFQVVHAGALGTFKGGVLLAGKEGSGKSTTALACLDSELMYLSDDHCLLATDPTPYAYSLYNSAKLNANNLYRFPHLQHAIINSEHLDTEKAMFFLHKDYSEKLVTGFPIRAILLPHVKGRLETVLTKASPITGLKALAPSTIFQLLRGGNVEFQFIAKLVKQVPCYSLQLGTDLSKIPEVILGLLSED